MTLLLLVAATGLADEVPPLLDPLPFRHAVHTETFAEVGLTCTFCHPVGLAEGTERGLAPPVETPLPAPLSVCHGCHLGEARGAPRDSGRQCATCHQDTGALLPADHLVAWIDRHGAEARARQATCRDCHSVNACIDCHDRRGPVVRSPHPPAFSSFHGIEARLAPRSCASCHAAVTCTTCHTEGVAPW